MGALLDQPALVNDQDPMRHPHRPQPMGDDEDRPAGADLREVLLDHVLGFVVEGARGFVEDQNAGIRHQRAGDGDPLPLPAGEVAAVLADQRVIAFRQRHDELMRAGELRRPDHRLERQARISQGDVVADGAVEEEVLLEHHADLPPEPRRVDLRQVHAVDQHPARLGHVQPLNQLGDRALSRPGPPDDPDHLARPDREG